MFPIVEPPVVSSTADEFLNALSPLGPYFVHVGLRDQWLFRGQGNDEPLTPSLFRKNALLEELTSRDITTYEQRLLAERDILIDFFEIADKRGLTLPDDSQQLRATLETLKSSRGDHFVGRGYQKWRVTDAALSLTALAQHYGLPTRLLDWSRQPFIAAYFAAESALKAISSDGSSGSIVVWGFYFPALGKHDIISAENDPIRVVTAPTASNLNLKAQQGVFTLVNPFYTKEAEQDYIPLERILGELADTADPEHSDAHKLIVDCRLRKFTLPQSEAPALLYLLARLDVTASAIYPGYRSIIDDLKMRNLWYKMDRLQGKS